MKTIYLDNSATTPVNEQAAKLAFDMMTKNFANPSSLYSLGLDAKNEIELAAQRISSALSCDRECIYFTSGGTESNNLALIGAAMAKKRTGNKIVTTAFEHSSVLDTLSELSKNGFEVVSVPPNSDGSFCLDRFLSQIDENTILATMMHTNNEIGTILPVEAAAKRAKKINPQLIFHCDAVQAFGKTPISLRKSEIDLLSISGHKIYAPKGVGALYIKKGVRILPTMFGGNQQNRIRPGTESTALIAAFGLACEIIKNDITKNLEKVKSLCEYFDFLAAKRDWIVLNHPSTASPYIRNISTMTHRGEIILHALESGGVYVSTGSACSKGAKSHVLESMGLEHRRIDSALRISFGINNDKEDIDIFFNLLDKAVEQLIKAY